ncbi:unnamed protein product [Periconia digitata]|uniref:Uncharacterized protein n=1 Tax=Periconia digitata TaxID=1303443 RepID=A0A9W4XZ46_9PLEO|nr:unnamed protein product [Periconia digitata]
MIETDSENPFDSSVLVNDSFRYTRSESDQHFFPSLLARLVTSVEWRRRLFSAFDVSVITLVIRVSKFVVSQSSHLNVTTKVIMMNSFDRL